MAISQNETESILYLSGLDDQDIIQLLQLLEKNNIISINVK